MKYWFKKTKEEAQKYLKDDITLQYIDARIACEVNNNFLIISNYK